MDLTEINKHQLLNTLTENRALHEAEYQKANRKWKKKATKALKKAALLAEEDGVITIFPLEDLPKPKHYLASYDQAIAKLEFEVKETVELDDREFAAWVLDDWTWRHAFIAETSLYNTR